MVDAVTAAMHDSEKDDDDALHGDIGLILQSRLTKHPEFESFDVYPNEWGGYTLQLEMKNGNFIIHGEGPHAVLAQANVFLWGIDG